MQALRAVAVLLVVGFHLWPEQLPGGYVGVDVFFAISGFLITGHLLRDLDAGRLSLGRFYLRRARRLLPASLLVLVVSMVGVLVLAPSTDWVASAQQVIASATYAQNWVLAGQHVDYLNPQIAPTAVQHFWSLSVEEQFYLVWPITLMIAGGALFARKGRRRAGTRRIGVPVVMAVLLVASFASAVWGVRNGIEGTYFFSTARVWQFAAGGLLAAVSLPAAPPVLRAVLGWAGFAAIGYAGLAFSATTGVPGTAALVPVLGTLAVIAAGHVDSRWSPADLVRFGPVQWVGGVSYALYLWHWPVIVLAPFVLGRSELGNRVLAGLLVLSLVLAGLTKWAVEDRLRGRSRPALVFTGATMVVALVLAGGAWLHVDRSATSARRLAAGALAENTRCFGAAAILDDTCASAPFGTDVTPAPADALGALTREDTFGRCFSMSDDDRIKNCTFDPAGRGRPVTHHIAVFGDSHAMHWMPALLGAAQQHGWRISTFMRSSCPPNLAVPDRPKAHDVDNCTRWTADTVERITADPSIDTVLTTTFNNRDWVPANGGDSFTTGVQGYRLTWQRLAAGSHRRIVVLRDSPRSSPAMLTCVASSSRGGTDCGRDQDDATTRPGKAWAGRPVPIEAAALRNRIPVVDLTDAFCRDGRCPAVIGNVLVYADNSHLTPTYSRTLAPVLGDRLARVLDAS